MHLVGFAVLAVSWWREWNVTLMTIGGTGMSEHVCVPWESVDMEKLRAWWLDPNRDPDDFVKEFDIYYERIVQSRKRLGLPPRAHRMPSNYLPTPEEIAEKCKECRERRLRIKRKFGHSDPQPTAPRCFTFAGQAYHETGALA